MTEFRRESASPVGGRVSAPTAVIATTIGALRVQALDGHHLLATSPGDDTTPQGSVAVCRVRYAVHLEFVARSLMQETSAGRRPADVPALEGTGFAITVDALVRVLRRVNRDRVQGWHPTEAARRVLLDELLPELARWLLSPEGAALVAAGEAFDLADVATVAESKAAELRAAVVELDRIAARASRGESVTLAEREGVRAGYRLITPA